MPESSLTLIEVLFDALRLSQEKWGVLLRDLHEFSEGFHGGDELLGKLLMLLILPGAAQRRETGIQSRGLGLHIVVEAGEADAHLELPPASAGSIAGELVTDRLALYDYALKSHVASWKGVNAALASASRLTR